VPEGIGNRDGPLAQFIGATYAVDCNLGGCLQATNIGEVVLIGTHGGELVIASGVSYLFAGKNFVIWSVMACVEAPPASTRSMQGKAGRSVVSILNVRFAPVAVVQRTSANRFSGLEAQLCSQPPDFHLCSSVQIRFGETGYDSNSLSGGA
jgi:hypothetical protein